MDAVKPDFGSDGEGAMQCRERLICSFLYLKYRHRFVTEDKSTESESTPS